MNYNYLNWFCQYLKTIFIEKKALQIRFSGPEGGVSTLSEESIQGGCGFVYPLDGDL